MKLTRNYQFKLKLGGISYLNMLPIRIGLEKLGIKERISTYPTQINQLILESKVDIAPVSSIFYAANEEKLFWLKDLGLAARGKVHSVLLVSNYPAEELEGKRVCLTAESASSARLTQIFFQEKEVKPQYFTEHLSDLEGNRADAILLIGDQALIARQKFSPQKYFIYDLAEEWFRLTGKPIVLALFVVRREAVVCCPDEVESLRKFILTAAEIGLSSIKEVLKIAQEKTNLEEQVLLDYFASLKYRLGEEEHEGLLEFFRRSFPEKYTDKSFITLENLSLIGGREVEAFSCI